MLNPSHPGAIIRDEVLPHFGLSVLAAAVALNTPRANLHKLLNGQTALTPEMALKIEKAFGTSADLMINTQAQYDLARARERAAEITAGVTRQQVAA